VIAPFGYKSGRFIKRPPEQDATLNLLDGATGAAKTWAINAKLISLLAQGYWPGGIGLISGNSKTTVKTNLLNDLESWVGSKRFHYNSQNGELLLCGKPFLVVGAKDEASWKAIRGSTVGIWIADEVTLYPQSFFDMAVTRLRLHGSRMYGSTNPSTPFHPLKKNYIDNPEKRANGDFWYEHLTLEDNPNLPEERKDFLRRQFVGVFYRRYILGEWCIADGSIYGHVLTDDIFYTDEWLRENHPGLKNNGGHAARFLAADYGTANPTVFIDIYDDGDTLWVDREWRHDSREENYQMTDAQYADKLIEFIGPIRAEVILDPSAASFAAELNTRGIYPTDADNEVLDGIRFVSTMLGRKKLRINRGCTRGVQELFAYGWNDKSAARGVEEPIKSADHFPDALRYACRTKINPWRLAA